MMLKNLLLIVFLVIASFNVIAQQEEFKPSGKVNGRIFFNYSYDMTKGEDKESAFDVKRAYLGYNYNLAKGVKADLVLDFGKNEGGSDYSAFLKKAELEWKASSSVKVSLGMISTLIFREQEKFWGYRYMTKSFNDEYRFGPSADLGIKADFKLTDAFSVKAIIVNGEGFRKVQDSDGNQKYGASLVYKHKGLMAKVYGDVTSAKAEDKTVTTSTLATFIGYNFSDKFRLAAEYNKLMNAKKFSEIADNYDLEGLSFYSTYVFDKEWEVFAKYDHLSSNVLEGETDRWNLSKDGGSMTTGVQYAPVKGLKMALNYRHFAYKDSAKDDKSQIFMNFEFKF